MQNNRINAALEGSEQARLIDHDRGGRGPTLPEARGTVPDSFPRRVVVAVLITLLLLGLAYLFWAGLTVLLEAFAGILFAVFLSALSEWVSRTTRLPHSWSLVVVVLALVLIASGLGWLLSSRLAAQVSELTQKLPQALQQLRAELEATPWGKFLLERGPEATRSLVGIERFFQLSGLISGITGAAVSVVVILFVGLFGAAEPEVYREGVLHLVPAKHRTRTREALHALVVNLRWWLMGQVFLMFSIGVLTAISLWLLGIPLALTLGIIAGLFELIPYLGPWLAAIPAILMAFMLSPWHVLAVAGLYLGIHILEGYIVLPLVQRRVVLMPPVVTLVSQVLLGELLGILGVFVAAPLTVCVVVLLKMLYVEDTLGDQNVKVPGEPECPKAAPAPQGG